MPLAKTRGECAESQDPFLLAPLAPLSPHLAAGLEADHVATARFAHDPAVFDTFRTASPAD
jgi:hypothetical protein